MWRNIIKEMTRRKMRHGETSLKAEVKKISKYRKQWGGRVSRENDQSYRKRGHG
jgi:hypothetical protein